jgi:hypothetical protein
MIILTEWAYMCEILFVLSGVIHPEPTVGAPCSQWQQFLEFTANIRRSQQSIVKDKHSRGVL